MNKNDIISALIIVLGAPVFYALMFIAWFFIGNPEITDGTVYVPEWIGYAYVAIIFPIGIFCRYKLEKRQFQKKYGKEF